MLFYYIVLKNDALRRIFGYKFIPIIGGMCYSIYLLHYTIIAICGRFTIGLAVTNYYLPNLALADRPPFHTCFGRISRILFVYRASIHVEQMAGYVDEK
jgi:hypothetical protein